MRRYNRTRATGKVLYEKLRSQLGFKTCGAVSMFYASMALVSSTFFQKVISDEKSCCPVKVYKEMPKSQKCFNGIILGCFAVDMTVSYLLLKGLKKITG